MPSSFSHLSDNTIRILIAETEGALAVSDVEAADEFGGVRESMRRYGTGWRADFQSSLDAYKAEQTRRNA